MGEVMYGCTFPGRMISCAGVVLCGDTTDTAVRATCEVSVRSCAFALTRDQIPDPIIATAAIRAIDAISHCLYERDFPPTPLDSGEFLSICITFSLLGDIIAPPCDA